MVRILPFARSILQKGFISVRERRNIAAMAGNIPFLSLPKYDHETYRHYREQVKNSGGFDVTVYPRVPMYLPYQPLDVDANIPGIDYGYLVASATFAIYHYNHLENPKRYFEFYKLLNATTTSVAGSIYYITFEATVQGRRDPSAVKTFQAVVLRHWSNTLKVDFCRLKDETMNLPRTGMTTYSHQNASPTNADWRRGHLEKRNHGPYSVASLDDVDVKTAAAVAMMLHSRYAIGYMFSNLVSAFFTDTDGARIFNITFEATGRWEENLNVVKTFEAVVWQMYPSFNLEVESCRLINDDEEEEEEASG